jgi:dCTP deaminase
MLLKADVIAKQLREPDNKKDPLVVCPEPDLNDLGKTGAASLDLRLGSWFQVFRQTRVPYLDVYKQESEVPSEMQLTKRIYVPFGDPFVLHPKAFVLAVTLEWIRLPASIAGYVVGRSSWGRHGLIIATATGVQPGFTGCLTLELTNVGEIPITIKPGTTICQIFLHQVQVANPALVDTSQFVGHRQPTVQGILLDPIARKLAETPF